MNNIILCLAYAFLISWVLIIISRFLKSEKLWIGGMRIFTGGLIISVIIIIYEYIVKITKMEHPWFSFGSGMLEQILLLLVFSGFLFIWVVKKYGPKSLAFLYIIFHAGIIYVLADITHLRSYIGYLERDIFIHISYCMTLVSHACGIIAGLCGIIWLVYLMQNKIPFIKSAHDPQSLHYQNLTKLIHWLVGMLLPFFIAGLFFHWVWAYRTQGVLWLWNRQILVLGLIGMIYLVYLNMASLKNKLNEYRAILVIVGLVLIVWFHVIRF